MKCCMCFSVAQHLEAHAMELMPGIVPCRRTPRSAEGRGTIQGSRAACIHSQRQAAAKQERARLSPTTPRHPTTAHRKTRPSVPLRVLLSKDTERCRKNYAAGLSGGRFNAVFCSAPRIRASTPVSSLSAKVSNPIMGTCKNDVRAGMVQFDHR